MIDFHKFETFDPNGPGLGNLFGQVSPFEALGIWPSGTSASPRATARCPPPATTSAPPSRWCCSSTAIWALLAPARDWRSSPASAPPRSPTSPPALGGTAYTAAKAIEIAAPLVALTILCR